jgi:hypothetical protein
MLPILKERFRGNIERVKTQVALYEWITSGVRGRPRVAESDLLRAAVVFLHAALEDLMREIAAWKLPDARPEVLSLVPYAGGDGRSTKLSLGDLAKHHRGMSVRDVIFESVLNHLDKSSYNDPDEIARLLAQIGCGASAIKRLMDRHGPNLGVAMSRRHQIAHRLDRNEDSGRGQHGTRSMSKKVVQIWIENIDRFSDDLFEEVEKISVSPEDAS